MTTPPDLSKLIIIPKVAFLIIAVIMVIWVTAKTVRYVRTARELRPILRKVWRIRRTWKRTARRVGLIQVERTRPPWWSNTPRTTTIIRELIPAITTHVEPWGVRLDVATVAQVGLTVRRALNDRRRTTVDRPRTVGCLWPC